jgi:hypothetical protein
VLFKEWYSKVIFIEEKNINAEAGDIDTEDGDVMEADDDNINTEVDGANTEGGDINTEMGGINTAMDNVDTVVDCIDSVEDSGNLFVLLYKLKDVLNEFSSRDLSELIPPVGNINNENESVENTNTLYGKVILVQKIVATVCGNFVPIHIPRFHHLLTHPECSISAAFKKTIEYISQEDEDPPIFTIENRINELHKVFKLSIVERLVSLNKYWGDAQQVWYNAQNAIAQISRRHAEVAFILGKSPVPLSTLYAPEDNPNSILARIRSIIDGLLADDFIMDDMEFALWSNLIGQQDAMNRKSIMGILNLFRENLANYRRGDVFAENLGLIGEENDVANVFRETNSLIGILNFLVKRCEGGGM